MLRVSFEQFKALRMRFYCHDSSIRPEMMAEKREAADMGSDVDYSANIVRTEIIDLVFVVEDRVGELGTGWLNPKVSPESLIAGCMRHSLHLPLMVNRGLN
jgi:hypothetical protein